MKTLNHERKFEKDIRKWKDIPLWKGSSYQSNLHIQFNPNQNIHNILQRKKKKENKKPKIQEESEKTPDSLNNPEQKAESRRDCYSKLVIKFGTGTKTNM